MTSRAFAFSMILVAGLVGCDSEPGTSLPQPIDPVDYGFTDRPEPPTRETPTLLPASFTDTIGPGGQAQSEGGEDEVISEEPHGEAPLCTPGSCDDSNSCTFDGCNPVVGCQFVPRMGECDDGDTCTLSDACSKGECVGEALDCSDDFACTVDTCVNGQGCSWEPQAQACDDGNACTTDACLPGFGCSHSVVQSNLCRPAFEVLAPARAASIAGQADDPFVTVTGSVSSGAGPIDTLVVNGEEVAFDAEQGSFEVVVPAEIGSNVLVIEATDELGGKKRRVQSFLWSPVWFAPGQPVADAVAVRLGAPAFDALQSVVESVLGDLDLTGAIQNPVTTNFAYEVDVESIGYDAPKVTLAPADGALKLDVVISGFNMDLDAVGKDIQCVLSPWGNWNCLSYPDVGGWVTIDELHVQAWVALSASDDGQLSASLSGVQVDAVGPEIAIDWTIGVVLNPILNLIVDAYKEELEETFEGAIADELGSQLASAMQPLAMSQTTQGVTLSTGFSSIDLDPSGAVITLGVSAVVDAADGADDTGSIGRAGCGQGVETLVVPGQSPIELVLSDDAVNHLLHAGWRAGFLQATHTVNDDKLADLGFGPVETTIDALSAPVVSSCGADGEVSLEIGDLRVLASTTVNGFELDIALHLSVSADFELVPEGDLVTIVVSQVVDLEIDAAVAQADLIAWEALLGETLAEHLLPEVVAAFGLKSLGGFALPTLDVQGSSLVLAPTGVTRVQGNTVVGGTLE